MTTDDHLFSTGTFARFHEDTRHKDVIDRSGNAVPKFIIWERFRDKPDEIEMILNCTHRDYYVFPNNTRKYFAMKALGLLQREA